MPLKGEEMMKESIKELWEKKNKLTGEKSKISDTIALYNCKISELSKRIDGIKNSGEKYQIERLESEKEFWNWYPNYLKNFKKRVLHDFENVNITLICILCLATVLTFNSRIGTFLSFVLSVGLVYSVSFLETMFEDFCHLKNLKKSYQSKDLLEEKINSLKLEKSKKEELINILENEINNKKDIIMNLHETYKKLDMESSLVDDGLNREFTTIWNDISFTYPDLSGNYLDNDFKLELKK